VYETTLKPVFGEVGTAMARKGVNRTRERKDRSKSLWSILTRVGEGRRVWEGVAERREACYCC
jgi:hypothetical protein